MVRFHIGVNFFGGDADVSVVEFAGIAEDTDDDEVVEVDLGIMLAAAGKPEGVFQGEAGTLSLVGLFDSEDGWD